MLSMSTCPFLLLLLDLVLVHLSSANKTGAFSLNCHIISHYLRPEVCFDSPVVKGIKIVKINLYPLQLSFYAYCHFKWDAKVAHLYHTFHK